MLFPRLRDYREDKDMTQKQIGEVLGIDQRIYSNYETGKRKIPVDLIIKLAKLYQTSADFLLGLTDDPKPYGK